MKKDKNKGETGKKRGRRTFYIVVAVLCALTAGAAAAGYPLKCVEYEVKSAKLNAPVKLAFLSDVHNSLYGDGQSGLTRKIEEFGADIVIFGGDLFDEYTTDENSWTLVEALADKYPCFYAVGNHEIWSGIAGYYKDEMRKRGVTVLDGGTELVSVNGQNIRICGAEGLYDGTLDTAREQLDDNFSVLMYHFPADFPQTSQMGFDLILSGHEHGGQWRLPGLINGLYAPDEGLFPEYAGGSYVSGKTTMLVSRGLYRRFDPLGLLRFFNNPEMLLITIGG